MVCPFPGPMKGCGQTRCACVQHWELPSDRHCLSPSRKTSLLSLSPMRGSP